MKDKEKQIEFEKRVNYNIGYCEDIPNKEIEEMAKDIEKVEKEVYSVIVKETQAYVQKHHKYNAKKDYSLAHTKTIHERTAEDMFKLGYRKLPKNSVVLSREEYDKFLRQDFIIDELKDCVKLASKKTAEKILTKLQPYIGGWVLFKELEKEYGVEIKE